jgi:hypothetical protein
MEYKEMENNQQPIDEAVGGAIVRFGKSLFTGLKNVFVRTDTKIIKYVSDEVSKVVGGLAKSNAKSVSLTAIRTSPGYKKSLSVLVEDLATKKFSKSYKDLALAQKQTLIKEASKSLDDVVKKELQTVGKKIASNIDNLKGAQLTKMGSKTAQITKTIAALDKIKYNKAVTLLRGNAKLVGEGKQGAAILKRIKGGKVNIVKGGQVQSAATKSLGETNIKVFRLSRGQWKTLAALGITGAAVLYLIGKLYPNDAVAVVDEDGNDGTQDGGGNSGGGNSGGGNSGGGSTKYTPCTSFPMSSGCKSDQIREVQSCLGMSQDFQTGNFGPLTIKALGGLKELTKEKYDEIIAKCKGTSVVTPPLVATLTGTTTGSTITGSTIPPITPPAPPAEPVMDKNRLQELLTSEKLFVKRGGKIVKWKGPQLSGEDYFILNKALEDKGYIQVKQRESGDRDDQDITMKYKWKKISQ